MADRCINLRQWEVLAALRGEKDGRPWQVRRTLKDCTISNVAWVEQAGRWSIIRDDGGRGDLVLNQPLGFPDDVLICREAWAYSNHERAGVVFAANGYSTPGWDIRSAATMPAWAARLRFHVERADCQRMRSATEQDAIEMGFRSRDGQHMSGMLHTSALDAFEESDPAAFEANVWQWVARGKVEVRNG